MFEVVTAGTGGRGVGNGFGVAPVVAHPPDTTVIPITKVQQASRRMGFVKLSAKMAQGIMEQTLLLNATYEPLKVVHWQKAITLWCQGKVEVISSYDREIHSVKFSFKLPSVIRLLRYIKIKRQIDYVPFSRANIYARDENKCQYCAEILPSAELTFDHVVPVAQGGRKDWENIVTCCIPCNRRKGGRTPEQAGMHLIRIPKRPDKAPAIRITIGLRNAPDSWRDYFYWNVELDDES